MMLQKGSLALALGKIISTSTTGLIQFPHLMLKSKEKEHTHIFFLLENKFCCIFWQFQITNCCWVPLRMQKKSSSTLAAFFLFFLRVRRKVSPANKSHKFKGKENGNCPPLFFLGESGWEYSFHSWFISCDCFRRDKAHGLPQEKR